MEWAVAVGKCAASRILTTGSTLFLLTVRLLLLALLYLTGCATFQPTDPYAPVPGQAVSAPAGHAGAGELSTLAAAQEGPLTLECCIEVALVNNPEPAATGWEASVGYEFSYGGRA